jgi:hypothetical protein
MIVKQHYKARARFSPFDTILEAEVAKVTLNQHLTKLNLIFNDGKYRIWVS